MLVLGHHFMHNKLPQYLSSFLPNTSVAINRCPMRSPRLQPPFHTNAYISNPKHLNTHFLFCSILYI